MTKEELTALLEKARKPIETVDELEKLFDKCYTNLYHAVDPQDKTKPMLYRREDLTNWAMKAFERGEKYFYCEPVNPDEPYGALRLCEPRYVYKMRRSLTPEEFENIFRKEG